MEVIGDLNQSFSQVTETKEPIGMGIRMGGWQARPVATNDSS